MTRKMTWVGLLVALALAVGQMSLAQAAPLQQQAGDPTVKLDGVVETYAADGTTVNGYDVTFTWPGGYTDTVHLTIQEAYDAGLLQDNGGTWATDGNGNPILVTTLPLTIPLPTDLVGTDPCTAPDGGGQPVGEALTATFCGSQGVSYDTIMGWQTSGYGFGVIAQALFMAQTLGSDPTLAAAILAAKTTGDYSALETTLQGLGFDTSTVRNWNWGQVKKLVMATEMKNMTNLGAVMSGRATPLVQPLTTTTTTTTVTTTSSTNPGNGNGKAKGQNGGGNGNTGNGNGNGNGNGKNKGN
jgi:hypothetical protein